MFPWIPIAKIKQRFISYSLEKRLVLIVSFIILLTIGAFSFFSFTLLKHRYEFMLYQSMATSSSLITHELTNRLNDTLLLSDVIRSDQTIQQHLDLIHRGEDYAAAKSYDTLYTAQQTYFQQYKKNYLSFSALINPVFISYTYGQRYEQLTWDQILVLSEAAAEKSGAPVWVSDYASRGQLFLARQIKKIESLELTNLGTLAIAVDMDALLEELTKESKNYQDIFWAFSQDGSLVYASKPLEGITNADLTCLDQPYGPVVIQGTTYFALRGTLDGLRWDYLQLIPYDAIAQSQSLLLCYYLLILLFSLFLTIFLIHSSIKWMTSDIRILYGKMKAFRGDNAAMVTVPYDYSGRNDEIARLHQYFDSMANEIQTLINNDYKLKLEMRTMQIKSLEAQINPHFLYNTLESINWRAKACKHTEISQMVESLGTLLRASLSNKKSLVPLREELELVQCYMTIQKIRFEERLRYSCDADASLLSLPLPPLSIQPLVENAIKYGLEETVDDCTILVSAKKEQANLLCITVRNNGSCFEDQLLQKLQQSEKQAQGLGIGLLNINQRIQLLFGEAYGLTCENEDGFAVARIRVPIEPKTA